MVSMTLGEGKKELANEYFSLIVYVTLAVSIVVGFICFALAPQIALALGADGELEADCVRYSRILFLSSPAFVMQYLFQSFFVLNFQLRFESLCRLASRERLFGCLHGIHGEVLGSGIQHP